MEHASFVIRTAKAGDAEEICELWKEAVALAGQYEPVFRPSDTAVPHFRDFLLEHLRLESSLVIVAQSNWRLVGYCIATTERYDGYYQPCKYGYVADLNVAARHRRSGIGSALLEKTKQWCVANSISRLEVSASSKNPLATEFWNSRGFHTYFETKCLEL